MSFLDRFRRNKQDSVLPEEVKEYYQAERRQKRGVAIGLALVALVVTVAVAAALFFGGRFAYNQIWGGDNNQENETSQNEDEDWTAQNEQESDQQSQQSQSNDQAEQPEQPPSQEPQPAPSPAPPTPPLGDEPLPHTGDPGM